MAVGGAIGGRSGEGAKAVVEDLVADVEVVAGDWARVGKERKLRSGANWSGNELSDRARLGLVKD
jgi:hypothetical protein